MLPIFQISWFPPSSCPSSHIIWTCWWIPSRKWESHSIIFFLQLYWSNRFLTHCCMSTPMSGWLPSSLPQSLPHPRSWLALLTRLEKTKARTSWSPCSSLDKGTYENCYGSRSDWGHSEYDVQFLLAVLVNSWKKQSKSFLLSLCF